MSEVSRTEQRAKLIELARQIWMALGLALPNLPPNTQAALRKRALDSDVRWVVSLVLAAAMAINRSRMPAAATLQQGRGFDATMVANLMAEMGVAFVVTQADPLMRQIPELPRALAEGSMDGAAAALTLAIRALPDNQRRLNDWLVGADLFDAAWPLVHRFPEPQSGRPPVWGEPAESDAVTMPSTRGERFDRADYGPGIRRV
jgi:hypothetical protein